MVYTPDREDLENEIWTLVHQEAVQRCSVDVTVHLGLDIKQERQLFHDLNNFVKKARQGYCPGIWIRSTR
jgi:hypothetical protein